MHGVLVLHLKSCHFIYFKQYLKWVFGCIWRKDQCSWGSETQTELRFKLVIAFNISIFSL